MPTALLLALLFPASSPAAAADEPPASEIRPAPKESEPEILAAPKEAGPSTFPLPAVPDLDPMYLRTSRYAVWQYYAVNQQNQWRPRVIFAPAGAYDLYNGAPFPWAETHSREFTPYADE